MVVLVVHRSFSEYEWYLNIYKQFTRCNAYATKACKKPKKEKKMQGILSDHNWKLQWFSIKNKQNSENVKKIWNGII